MFFCFQEISGFSNRFETYQASGTHLLKSFIFLVTLSSSNMNSPFFTVNFSKNREQHDGKLQSSCLFLFLWAFVSITQQEFPIKEKRAGENNKIYIAIEKIYDGYEIQRQVMNGEIRLRSSILSQLFFNQLLKRLHKNSTPQVAIAEWGKNVSSCKKREIIADRVPCKE